MYAVILVGTAGAGKSYLTAALSSWLQDNEMSVTTVNLDPACDWLPYTPDVDVRNYIDVRTVMSKYGLGPNGALVAAVDMVVNYVSALRDEILSQSSNYVLIDTPGQMELFAYRPSGPTLIEELLQEVKTVVVYLLDAFLAKQASGMISSLLLALSVNARMKKPQIVVLSKSDLLTAEDMERIDQWLKEPSILEADALSEGVPPSVAELAYKVCEAIGEEAEIIPVSARTGEGLDSLYALLQRVIAGGEDYLTEEPSSRL